MKRRDFLFGMAAMGGGTAINELYSAQKSDTDNDKTGGDRPNILILLSDQHNPHVLGCYGDKIVRTPNLDRLAQKGAIFEHNYCAAPLCVPSKSSLLTGLGPNESGIWSNTDILPSDTSTFAHSLGAAGYDTTLIGHMHFCGPDQRHGFDNTLVGSPTPQYPNCTPFLPPDFLVGATCSSRQAVTLAGPGQTAYGVFSENVAKATAQYLRQKVGAQDRPFCALAGFLLPHPPFICPKEQWDYYLDKVEVPGVPPQYFERLNPVIQLWRQHRGLDNLTTKEVRRARAAYYGMITELDRQIGIVLDTLTETGLDKNTVVIYTSDHGEMAGENGMWCKMNMYEGSVSVPLIISYPGRIPAGRRVSEITNLIDMRRTLDMLAGTGDIRIGEGRDLIPLARDDSRNWKNETFSEYPMTYYDEPPMRMIRQDKWKLVYFKGYPPQLFDLENDPHEFYDLGRDPRYAEIRSGLIARVLADWKVDEIEQILRERARQQKILYRWAMATRPPCPGQWVAPKGANVFSFS